MKKFALVMILLLVVAGCGDTASMYSASSLGYGMMAQNPTLTLQQQQSAAALGTIMATEGQRTHEMNVAREGRSQVTINNNTSQPSSTGAGQPRTSSASRWLDDLLGEGVDASVTVLLAKDTNGNGRFELMPEELIKANIFNRNDTFVIVCRFPPNCAKLYIEVYDQEKQETLTGRILKENNATVPGIVFSIDTLLPVNHIASFYEKGGVNVTGSKRYVAQVFLSKSDSSPISEKVFYVNFD